MTNECMTCPLFPITLHNTGMSDADETQIYKMALLLTLYMAKILQTPDIHAPMCLLNITFQI